MMVTTVNPDWPSWLGEVDWFDDPGPGLAADVVAAFEAASAATAALHAAAEAYVDGVRSAVMADSHPFIGRAAAVRLGGAVWPIDPVLPDRLVAEAALAAVTAGRHLIRSALWKVVSDNRSGAVTASERLAVVAGA